MKRKVAQNATDSLAWLLGSSTRANVVRALASSDESLTAYRLAKEFNLNVAKVYKELRKMAEIGLAKALGDGRGVEYILADEDLRRLALKMSPGFVTLSKWSSEGEGRFRFNAGLKGRGEFPRRTLPSNIPVKQTRMPGELESLAKVGRRAFDSRYRELDQGALGVV